MSDSVTLCLSSSCCDILHCRSVLQENGHDCVRVLAYQKDFEAVQLYYEFVEHLYT